jgi:hypothetical protein
VPVLAVYFQSYVEVRQEKINAITTYLKFLQVFDSEFIKRLPYLGFKISFTSELSIATERTKLVCWSFLGCLKFFFTVFTLSDSYIGMTAYQATNRVSVRSSCIHNKFFATDGTRLGNFWDSIKAAFVSAVSFISFDSGWCEVKRPITLWTGSIFTLAGTLGRFIFYLIMPRFSLFNHRVFVPLSRKHKPALMCAWRSGHSRPSSINAGLCSQFDMIVNRVQKNSVDVLSVRSSTMIPQIGMCVNA